MEREPRASEAAPAAAALFAWGANSYGQLGLGHKEDVLLPQQLTDFCRPKCIRRITGGGGHSAVVTDAGGLFVCGLNKHGQLGLGHTEDVLYFTLCKSLLGCPIQQVACGWDFTILLTENGQVLSCGSNSFGQLGVPHGPRRCVVPQTIELLREKVVHVAAGLRHGLAVTVSGMVFQWGTGLASSGRRLCPGKTLPLFLTAKEPSRVTGLENSRAICVVAGSDHSASLNDAGELYVWGSNKHGQLATQAAFLPVPHKIEVCCFQNEKVTTIWSGWTHLVAQTETGKVFTWGRADYGQLGRKLESYDSWEPENQDSSLPCSTPWNSIPSSLHCLTGATEISCGSEHNVAVIGPCLSYWYVAAASLLTWPAALTPSLLSPSTQGCHGPWPGGALQPACSQPQPFLGDLRPQTLLWVNSPTSWLGLASSCCLWPCPEGTIDPWHDP
ncbi:secretion-regulating guanine nucleotide exchange factor isoform X2 [Ochotona princeps]|uniref:secretion-regulating guanine nucleotide exchange factor isoform X2 n=1 Tax=Ochotona princeps TaxID=9978 RepID=UPI002715239B|nr:secretion-regulating guanine nucleotide exchange factor isoform X2 [Ochotona princeps]